MEFPGWNHNLHDSLTASARSNLSAAHCQMLHIAIVVVVEALAWYFVTYKLNRKSCSTNLLAHSLSKLMYQSEL